MLVGEAWGADEDRKGEPFVGASGEELNKMLHEVGIMRSECFVTNLVNHRPPGRAQGRPVDNDFTAWVATSKKGKNGITSEHVLLRDKYVKPIVKTGYLQLMEEIRAVKPNLIIPFGNWSMWALTGQYGVLKWRGSQLRMDHGGMLPLEGDLVLPKVIPTIHPAAVLREWSVRAEVIQDLRRARRHMDSKEYDPPQWDFRIAPNFELACEKLTWLLREIEAGRLSWVELDLETSSGHIACCGVSWTKLDAICVPFMCRRSREGYYAAEEEAILVYLFYKILTHPKVKVRLQNGLYDAQYTYRWWHFVPRVEQDTMISQHALFSDQPKKLSYQASLYANWYVYWKDEGKNLAKGGTEEEHWRYNCLDDVYTREVGEVELQIVETFSTSQAGRPAQWPSCRAVHTFQQHMFWPVLQAMIGGISVREDSAADLAVEIQAQIELRESFLKEVIGYTINPRSTQQLQEFFYVDMKQQVIMSRPKKGAPSAPTCNDEALVKIGTREPLLRPITSCIADIRTLEKFLDDFVMAKRDTDGKMRSSFNIGGSESGKSAPKTYRLSSSKNAFGGGANLQTIPSEKSKSVGKWEQRQHFSMIGDPYKLPNLRAMYGPDKGQTFFDLDLDRADLYGMAWDAEEPILKAALKMRCDVHLLNVYIIDGQEPPPLEELIESHPKYPDHRGPRKLKREFAKVFAHATDYLGKGRTVAAATGRTVHEIDRAQKIYLGTYKGIAAWQNRIIEQVRKHRFVENKFGYRWYIMDRIDDQVMPEAVAWIPQSITSLVINRIWMNLFQGCTEKDWNFDSQHLMQLLHNPANGIRVLLQVHDSLAGEFPTHMTESSLKKIQELSSIIVPYDDPLIIPTGIGTSVVSWGHC